VTHDVVPAAIDAGVEHRFRGESPDGAAAEAFAATLHAADLGLACACRTVHEEAWEPFIRQDS
jgi:hypothetical protein